MVPVEREFRRLIAYDVDYVYKGDKYRSRLPYDPGNRSARAGLGDSLSRRRSR